MSNNKPIYKDLHGRGIGYLRLSVTDRCNLQCRYCVNTRRQEFIPHDKILRYEEYLRLITILSRLGIRKIRITGGEPFIRKGVVSFMAAIRRNFPDHKLAVTTNGTLLDEYLSSLVPLRLESFNISLDALDGQILSHLTGKNNMNQILKAIDQLLRNGQRVKLNAVAMRDVAERQIKNFLAYIKDTPVDVRFIEFMPVGSNTLWNADCYIASVELQKIAAQYATLTPAPSSEELSGPAKMFTVAGAKGRIGFISAISDHFCGTCQRLRLTSDGKLRSCLFADRETDLRKLLRHKKLQDAQIEKAIIGTIRSKPLGADLLLHRKNLAVAATQMVGIGG